MYKIRHNGMVTKIASSPPCVKLRCQKTQSFNNIRQELFEFEISYSQTHTHDKLTNKHGGVKTFTTYIPAGLPYRTWLRHSAMLSQISKYRICPNKHALRVDSAFKGLGSNAKYLGNFPWKYFGLGKETIFVQVFSESEVFWDIGHLKI